MGLSVPDSALTSLAAEHHHALDQQKDSHSEEKMDPTWAGKRKSADGPDYEHGDGGDYPYIH
jgi:hypothetical protein